MKKSIAISALTGVLAGGLLLAGAANASNPGDCGKRGGHHGHHHMGKRPHDTQVSDRLARIAKRLELSQEQRESVGKILKEIDPRMRTQINQVHRGHKALSDLVDAPNYDRARVRQVAEAQAEAKAELIVLRMDMKNRIKAELTPEQQARWTEMHGRSFRY